jgi:preprotein translocase subunit SecA
MPAFVDKILRAGEGRILRDLTKVVALVNAQEARFVAMSDSDLRNQTVLFKERLAKGETLDDLLPEAFAVVREAAKRTLGQRHYDVQIMGGAALHRGNIAEMRTGEGKTLVSTLPSYLNALAGHGVHVVTTNDYLAERDSEWMGRVHRFLGLKVDVILANMTSAERRKAYLADITYGTNNEFGFDYLRDNMATSLEECVQREHFFAVVDEVDSILIDEARTPLIISGPADKPTKWYVEFANLVQKLQRDVHYEVDEKKKTCGIIEEGITKVEQILGIDNLYKDETAELDNQEIANTTLIGYLNNAIRAKELFKRDRDYVVMNGELLIVDEHTGRMLSGRRYSEGLHQALEAKERITIQNENQTLATITLQNYFRLYSKLSGMTGTAVTEASEFQQIYKLGVVPIPTNRDMQRIDSPDLVYKTEVGKFVAVTADIVERHRKGQPVLVGTVSVEKSEELSSFLLKSGVPHEVLNAKHHEREAAIIARAGVRGAVTVATNMAGRGTDIMLGGNPEFMADFELQRRGISPVDNAEEYEEEWPAEIARQKAAVEKGHEEVVALGGLYVLGTERHESRRIDNQLRGRSGRQGDPGESRFYLSLQDDLMRRFNSALVERFLTAAGLPEDAPIESKMVSNAIRSAQTQVEAQNFEMRKNVLKYDDVMNRQRTVIYGERRDVLEGADIKDQLAGFMSETLSAYVDAATSNGYAEDWDLEKLFAAVGAIYPISFTIEQLIAEVGSLQGLDEEFLKARFVKDCEAAYAKREADIKAQRAKFTSDTLSAYVDAATAEGNAKDWDLEGLITAVGAVNLMPLTIEELVAVVESLPELNAETLKVRLVEFEAAKFADQAMREAERHVLLFVLDRRWREHLYEMDYLQEGIGLRAMAQRDPLVEYQKEGFDLFAAMMDAIKEEIARLLFTIPIIAESADKQIVVPGLEVKKVPTTGLQYTSPDESGPRTTGEVSRNAPCPCGSGKKYKRCHGGAA